MVPCLIQCCQPLGGQTNWLSCILSLFAFNHEKSLDWEKTLSKGRSIRSETGQRLGTQSAEPILSSPCRNLLRRSHPSDGQTHSQHSKEFDYFTVSYKISIENLILCSWALNGMPDTQSSGPAGLFIWQARFGFQGTTPETMEGSVGEIKR